MNYNIMKYIFKYEDSMRQCETLHTENIVKLSNYSEYLLQSSSISSSESTERNKEYEIIKEKLDTAQENIATLKSEYDDLTQHFSKSTSFGINFREKFFNYLACQETLRLKFIETINLCKQINSNLDNILRDRSNETVNKNFIQNASQHSEVEQNRSNRADGFDLSSIPKVFVLLPKLDWDCSNPRTSDSHNLETSFSNEHSEELCTSATASASKSLEVSPTDLNIDVAVKKRNSMSVFKTKKLKNWASLKRNEAPNLSQLLVCKICHRSISGKGSMKTHMFLHRGLKPFECADCGKSFALKQNMKSHIFSMHMPYQSRPYKCDICSKFYSSLSNLNYHRCSAIARRKTVSDRGQSPICNICRKHFNRQSDLKRHMLIHEGLKPFKCAECGKSFRSNDKMNLHIGSCHTPYHTRQYVCDICGKRYAAQFHLNTHKRLAGHYCSSKLSKFTSANVDDGATVEKHDSTIVLRAKKVRKLVSSKRKKNSNSSQTFVCNVCDRNFSRRQDLKRHMILHEASKPFKCAECDKSFATKDNMRQHIVLMHINDLRSLDSLDSYYYCAHCKCRCQSKESLVYHIKENHVSSLSVDEISCTVCGKTFTNRRDRTYHKRWVHVGKKCFCCTKCGNRYKYASGLERHLELEQCK